MKARNEYKLLCRSIKNALKMQKVTYRELAAKIGMSESGLKKILGGDDASFQRLAQIADALGLTLTDLMNESDKRNLENVSFTEEQERFLVKNIDCFHYYWKLVYERMSVEEIETEYGLSPKESFGYLKKLDELGMIGLGPQRRLKLPPLARIRWAGGGPLVEKLYQDWGVATVRALARPLDKLGENELFIIRYFKLQENSYEEFLKAHRELEAEFVKRAIREMALNLPKMKLVRWVTAVDDKSFLSRLK